MNKLQYLSFIKKSKKKKINIFIAIFQQNESNWTPHKMS